MAKHSGSEWIDNAVRNRKHWKSGDKMSEFGKEVGDILGQVWLGIYHMELSKLEKIDWSDNYVISLIIRDELSTFDYDRLTQLVVLCHDRMIRMSIKGCGPSMMRLLFHKRTSRTGSISYRMPTLLEHVEIIRKYHGDVLPELEGA